VSFQITVLKVLAGHPGGRASLSDLRRAVAILISSGSDWTDRTKRLAARVPDLDIFVQSFVLRDDAGWQITDARLTLLATIEATVAMTAVDEQPLDLVVEPTPLSLSPPIKLIGINPRSGAPRSAESARRSVQIRPPGRLPQGPNPTTGGNSTG
jgi:hypothetical protein